MTQDEADARAKALYGSKAFVKISHFGSCDIDIDQSWTKDGKLYYQAWLIGWGATWEEAFNMAERKYPDLKQKPAPPQQLKLF